MRAVSLVLGMVACGRGQPAEVRELAAVQADGVELTARAELRAWYVAGHLGPEFRWVAGRDHWNLYEVVEAQRAGVGLPVYDAGEIAPLGPYADAEAGRAGVAALVADVCPLPHGFAYRAAGRGWVAVWVVGDEVFRSPLEVQGSDCGTTAFPVRDSWLAAHPGGPTTCRALDGAGRGDLLLDCYLAGGSGHDLPAHEPLPDAGPRELQVRPLTQVDGDAVRRRLGADPAAVDHLAGGLLDGSLDPVAAMGVLEAAGQQEAIVTRLRDQCRDPARACTAGALDMAEKQLRPKGQLVADGCAKAAELATVVEARPEPDALQRSFVVVRGFFRCGGDEFRPLMLKGLALTGTGDDSATVTHCREYTMSGAPDVSSLCDAFPRFAGSWLSHHCGPDAVQIARTHLASRETEPFDPRADMALDGALRVLGRCDVEGFETAIGHLPAASQAGLREQFSVAARP